MQRIVYNCGKKIVSRGYGVKISRKMQIYLVHRKNLRVSSSGGSALYSEHRAERRLAQCKHSLFSELSERLCYAYGHCGFTLSCRRRVYRRDKHKLSVFAFSRFYFAHKLI